MKSIDVVGAVIVDNGRVLCAKRGDHGSLARKWEFPGGKINPGESPKAALEREVREELQCVVDVGAKITTTIHEYDFATVSLTTFYCSLADGIPRPTEHSDLIWLSPSELESLDWAPADMPAVHIISAETFQ